MLEHSIRKHASCAVDIHWMRAGDSRFEITEHGDPGTWKINVAPGSAWKKRGAWGTPFSCFRFAVPELCAFTGRAVYLDADMLVLGDVRELLTTDLVNGYKTISMPRTDVAVIDCAYFADKTWWPSIEKMRPSGWITWHYCKLLQQHGAITPSLDPKWNVCDRPMPTPDHGVGDAKLLHYTTVPTQPYKPYPSVTYYTHAWKSWVDAWNACLEAARATA